MDCKERSRQIFALEIEELKKVAEHIGEPAVTGEE